MTFCRLQQNATHSMEAWWPCYLCKRYRSAVSLIPPAYQIRVVDCVSWFPLFSWDFCALPAVSEPLERWRRFVWWIALHKPCTIFRLLKTTIASKRPAALKTSPWKPCSAHKKLIHIVLLSRGFTKKGAGISNLSVLVISISTFSYLFSFIDWTQQ